MYYLFFELGEIILVLEISIFEFKIDFSDYNADLKIKKKFPLFHILSILLNSRKLISIVLFSFGFQSTTISKMNIAIVSRILWTRY